ncbi:hypothetical protein [Fibrella arboris]|uniref:hypothetical protein n=1 Tax=Fibrella arboris TaxID=3242486 RepID=UPI003521F672
MRTQLLTFSACYLLVACSGLLHNVPPAFTGKAVSDLPIRIKSYSYPAYRQGVQYKATANYTYDAQNRLIRIDSISYGQSIAYRYTDNRLAERLTYQNGTPLIRTQFFYNATGELEKTVEQNGTVATETTYQFDNSGQLTERKTVYLSSPNDAFISRYTWKNGNMVVRVDMNGKGQERSEWSYSYDQQPNYKALLTVNPDPDQPRTYNNQIGGKLERDYTGLIDLCSNPFGSRYSYLPNGLATRWETSSCSLYYNEIEYEAKQ